MEIDRNLLKLNICSPSYNIILINIATEGSKFPNFIFLFL